MPSLITSSFILVVTQLVQDTAAKLGPMDYATAIDAALETYGTDKPLILSLDVVGNGTSDLPLSALTSLDDRYLADLHYGLSIEYPIISTGYPTPLYRESWIF